MNKDLRFFTILYIIIVIADLIGLIWVPEIRVATKPLIMTSLLGYYILNERGDRSHSQNHLFLTALIFALMGDVFLNFNMDGMFEIGLISFMIMQLMYSGVFLQDKGNPGAWKILPVLVILGAGLNYILWDYTESMRWMVVLYSAVIMLMVYGAYARDVRIDGYRWVFGGAVLFMISDSLLSIYKFCISAPWLAVMVMIIYAVAQYLIVLGYKKKPGI